MAQIKLPDASHINFLANDDSPWFERKVKVVMVIIDAMRFDYLLEYENIDHLERLKQNKFKKFNQAYYDDPEKFVVLRARSDSPTFTSMRVPCFMTGNIPEKAHIMTNFGGLAISEDSLLRQIKLAGKKTYFAGDPVLHQYFPEYLTVGTQTRGFDIRDDQVDDATHDFIKQKITDNDFDMLIAHLLMIDHTAHFHDLFDERTAKAIENVDQFIMEVIQMIDDDTMLIFAGDHGMTKSGDHGGGEPQEVNTAIVAYHNKGFMKYRIGNELKKVMKSLNDTEAQIRQVDIVPTLAMLMGVRIPFGNMGQMLNDLYPNSDDLMSQSSFEMKMLHDNHLNTLQILNYFEKYQKQNHIANKKELFKIKHMAQEVEDAYKAAAAAQELTNEVTVNAIFKSQELASEIYDLVNTKTPYEMAIFYQGFALLILVAISYVMIIQFISRTKDYEYITWKSTFKNWKSVLKLVVPVIVIIALIWSIMLSHHAKIMHPITLSVSILGLSLFGSSIFFFVSKHQDHDDSTSPSEEQRENLPSLPSFKSLFVFQSPRITAGAIAIFGYLFYLVHAFNLDKEKLDKRHYLDPYVILLLIASRLCGRYLNLHKHIVVITIVLCVGLHFVNFLPYMTDKVNTVIGLLFMADWVWNEAKFAQNKLKCKKPWSYQYFIGFGALTVYHMIPNREAEFVQITLPRVIWMISIGSCLTSFGLKMPSRVIKRNMQAYLVLFMALLQAPKRVLYFAMVLSAMRVANFVFKRLSFKNFLYPIIIGFLGYVGIFMLNYTDRTFPRNFAPAFVGLKDFNIVFSLLFFTIAMMSSVILGTLFLSYHNQSTTTLENNVKIGAPKDDPKIEACELKGHSTILKKRNIILYGFFYNLILVSASIKIILYRETQLDHEGVMEKFFIDSAFYIVIMIIVYFML